MSFLAKLRLSFGLGLLIPILVLVILVLTNQSTLNSVYSGFVEYRGLARDTNLAGRLQANMLMVRMNVKDFLIRGEQKDVEEYHHYLKLMNGFLEEAKQEIQKPERAKLISEIAQQVTQYEASFAEVIEMRKTRDHLVNDILNVEGLAIRKNLSEIASSAYRDRDAEAAYYAGQMQERLLLARLYVIKFLDENRQEYVDRSKAEFEQVRKWGNDLNRRLQNPKRRALLAEAQTKFQAYQKAFIEVSDLIFQRNKIIEESLDKIGPQIAKAAEDVKLSVKEDQDALGPMVQALVEDSVSRGMIFGSGAVLVSLLLGFLAVQFVAKMVMNPLGGEPEEMAKIAQQVSTGNLTIQFDLSGAVTGLYASMRDMAQQLINSMRQITYGSRELSSTSAELSQVSSELQSTSSEVASQASASSSAITQIDTNLRTMAASAEELSSNVETISATATELSQNMRSVNDSAGEMITSIQAVEKRSQEAATEAQSAATNSQEALEAMNSLDRAAQEVGEVILIIKEIAQQTNLLALNANIEAASAGEAGKGFAVVANEIKELANQSAKAADGITSKISGMQSETSKAQEIVEGMASVIVGVSETSQLIGENTTEQSRSIQAIAGNIKEASIGVDEMSRLLSEMSTAIKGFAEQSGEITSGSKEVSRAVEQMQQAANDLARHAAQVAEEVKGMASIAINLDEVVSFFKLD